MVSLSLSLSLPGPAFCCWPLQVDRHVLAGGCGGLQRRGPCSQPPRQLWALPGGCGRNRLPVRPGPTPARRKLWGSSLGWQQEEGPPGRGPSRCQLPGCGCTWGQCGGQGPPGGPCAASCGTEAGLAAWPQAPYPVAHNACPGEGPDLQEAPGFSP